MLPFSTSLSSMLKTTVVVVWNIIRHKKRTREKRVNVVRHKVKVDIDRKIEEKVGLGGAGGRCRAEADVLFVNVDAVESCAKMWQLSKRASFERKVLQESGHRFGNLYVLWRVAFLPQSNDLQGHHQTALFLSEGFKDDESDADEISKGVVRSVLGQTCGLLLLILSNIFPGFLSLGLFSPIWKPECVVSKALTLSKSELLSES